MLMLRWLAAVAALLGFWLVSAASGPAHAQSCTADFQCNPTGLGNNICLGDTLIMRRRLCVGGMCQEQETGRINCNVGGGLGTCQGNRFVRSGGRCDALAGRCAQGSTIPITCVRSCSCRGNTLVVSTGTCTPGIGCGQAVVRCKKGCTCSPEARCLEDPVPLSAKGAPLLRPAPPLIERRPRVTRKKRKGKRRR